MEPAAETVETYTIKTFCTNCENDSRVEIPFGRNFNHALCPCPHCGCCELCVVPRSVGL